MDTSATEESENPLDVAFGEILTHINDEEYDRCATSSRIFVKRYKGSDEAKSYVPYAEFFKLFADAYHTWQGSYHYTPIRSSFLMASKRLQNLPAGISNAPDHKAVVKGLNELCEMLCDYTWCENSAINNDPFALERYSWAAIEHENAGRSCLISFSSKEPHLTGIATWLVEYFEKNLYLHTGLNACAKIYSCIMSDRACPDNVLFDQMRLAKEALVKLTPLSEELSSELNAHIRHVHQHYARLDRPSVPQTFLRVRSGKLVLSLTAACSRAGVQRILTDRSRESREFKERASHQLERLGIEVDEHSFRPTPLMDIFETSFGEHFLKSLTFDIKPKTEPHTPVKLTFLDGSSFDFSLSVTLSALGTCTLAFELALNEDEFKNGLSVEEIRALESCICPHAGHVELGIPWAGKPVASSAGFCDRVDIITLRKRIESLSEPAVSVSKAKVVSELDAYLNHTLTEAHGMTAKDRQARDEKICNAVNEVIPDVTLTEELKDLLDCCLCHTRLAEFGEQVLAVVEQAFCGAIGMDCSEREALGSDEVWNFRADLGWYAYLYATRIDKVDAALRPVKESVAFSEIEDHPDTLGLVIDQREARASFDDWRFMKRELTTDNNLAYVRSHASDAFYTSEFQTFFYFPDDPKYLVDQYEETVKLNLRLNVGLRFYNWMAEDLTYRIREHEGSAASEQDPLQNPGSKPKRGRGIRRFTTWLRSLWTSFWNYFRKARVVRKLHDWVLRQRRDHQRMQELTKDLDRVRRLRFEANELRNLVLKAGISRYHDHGQFMKRILDQTNVEAAALITDRHLGQLEELNREIIERLKAAQFNWLSRAGIVVGCLLGASATKDFVDALYDKAERPWEFRFMTIVLVASLVIFLIQGKSPSDK